MNTNWMMEQSSRGTLALKGTIDLITDVGDGVYEIIDWKTGRRLDLGYRERENTSQATKRSTVKNVSSCVQKALPRR